MRLQDQEIESIKNAFQSVFQHGSIYLFGSRTDESRPGGDIDLYIVPEKVQNLAEKKIEFLVEVKRLLGEQKIDVVIDRGGHRAIDEVARKQGVLLWKS